MPQYKKVFDVGTYAGVSGYTRVGIPTLRTPGAGGKQVAKSLRFRSANSAYLSRTFGTPTSQNTWTYSCWLKRGQISGGSFNFGPSATGGNYQIWIEGDGTINFYNASVYVFTTTSVYRDPSAWYHIILAVNSGASGTNKVRLYVNGVEITVFSTDNRSTFSSSVVNTAVAHNIGRYANGATNYFDGYMSEVYFIDGTALDPTSFGEYNSDNIWVPKAYSGSYAGTNSCYLDFSDVGTTTAGGANTGYGKDLSGKGTPNNWTTNNFGTTSTATTYDSMYDSPTDYDNSVYGAGNYAVLNPLDKGSSAVCSDGNLTFSVIGQIRATTGITSGKWYWEVSPTSSSATIGISKSSSPLTGYVGGDAGGYSYYGFNGNKYNSGTGVAYGSAFGSGSVIGVAFDADNGLLWFALNNTWQASGVPTSGTGYAYNGLTSGPYFPSVGDNGASATQTGVFNFGQRPFAYTPPTGFKALNTKNITRPTDANMWFYGDTPDLMWIKNRTASSTDHSLTDTVRGVGLGLSSSSTAVEQGAQDVAEMNKFGMTLIGASSRTTAASNNFVYWAWKGGGAAVTNTSGSITSTVSANTSAGFSVVTFTQPSASPWIATVGHGLGVAPSMIIYKDRSAANNWLVYHSSLGATKYLYLSAANAAATGSNAFNDTAPTPTVFTTTAGSTYFGNSGATCVAYCFAPVAGYSAFGSYTGNGSADGPFIFTGFRPRWLMVKNTSTAVTDWFIVDSSINTYNVVSALLVPNSSGAEVSSLTICDFLSNGFKFRDTNASRNASGSTYIYAAFAEFPFKIARAR